MKVENIVLEIPFPKSVLNVTLTTTQGKYSFDPVTKVMTWDVGKMDSAKLPNIRGSVCRPVIVPFTFYLSFGVDYVQCWGRPSTAAQCATPT